MVSKASRIIGKGERYEVEIEGGEKVGWIIRPLKNKDLLIVMDLSEQRKTTEMLTHLIKKSIEGDDNEVTDEDVQNMPYMFDILKVIDDVNHFGGMFDFRASGQMLMNQNASLPASNEERLDKLKARTAAQRP